MNETEKIFEDVIEWLKNNYNNYSFYLERDIVWTVQNKLVELILNKKMDCKTYNDYPILPGNQRSVCTDIAIVNLDNIVEVAVEFKYEPSHNRGDLLKSKFPVVFWGKDGVGKDMAKITEYINNKAAKVSYLVFIDEGGYFRYRNPFPNSKWIDWGASNNKFPKLSVLWAKLK